MVNEDAFYLSGQARSEFPRESDGSALWARLESKSASTEADLRARCEPPPSGNAWSTLLNSLVHLVISVLPFRDSM